MSTEQGRPGCGAEGAMSNGMMNGRNAILIYDSVIGSLGDKDGLRFVSARIISMRHGCDAMDTLYNNYTT